MSKQKEDIQKFDLSKKILQHSVIKRIQSLHSGIIDGPIVVDFDCSTSCNLNCFFCISKNMIGNKMFSYDELYSWAKVFKAMDVRAVILTGGGEPLTNPYIDDFISILKEMNIQIGLVTNGLLMSKCKNLHLCDWVRVSLDAGNASTFQALKGIDGFDTIVRNIINLNQHKGSCESGLSFLISHDKDKGVSNINEIYSAASLAKNIKCDYFELKLQFNMNHQDIVVDDESVGRIKKQIEEILLLETNTFKVYLNHNLSFLINNQDCKNGDVNKCHICNLRTVISPRGLFLCSYFRGNEQFKYGESDAEKFQKLWFSDTRQRMIESVKMDTTCNFNCARKKSNQLIQKLFTLFDDNQLILNESKDTDFFI